MGLNPGERQLLQDLLERVRRLEQARAPSAGVGLFVETQHGVSYAKTPQPGFPAELTGTYNATTGYPAKRLRLRTTSTPGFVTDTTPETFTNCFTLDGDTSLTSGTKGWAEPSPDGSGYCFVKQSAVVASSSVFLARLTTSGLNAGGVTGWNFYKQRLFFAGTYNDDGSEVTGFNAIAAKIDGTLLCNPVGGLRVLMFASQNAGQYEFLPIGFADRSGGVDFPGLVATDARTWTGSKTLNSGNVTLTSGNLTLTSGNATLSAGNLSVTGTGSFTGVLHTDSNLTVGGSATITGDTSSSGGNVQLLASCTFGSGSDDNVGPGIRFGTAGSGPCLGVLSSGDACLNIGNGSAARLLLTNFTGGSLFSVTYAVRTGSGAGGIKDGGAFSQGYKDAGGLNRTFVTYGGLMNST